VIDEFEELEINSVEVLDRSIKKIESMIRNSYEYRKYISYILDEKEFANPLFDDYDLENVTQELHHIISLYDLVKLAAYDLIVKQEKSDLLSFDIAKEVINLHLDDLIPVCILPKNVHELVHSSQYTIAKEEVHLGKYKIFLKKYKEDFDKDVIKIYQDHGAIGLEEFIKEEK